MSICNKRITNRGFVFLPFCPIYGVGATVGCIILSPLIGNVILLYTVSALVATIFEFLVAKIMLIIFGELWWDYKDKPLNYKGVLCLESTLAWGLYGIVIVKFLNENIFRMIDSVKVPLGIKLCKFILVIVIIDFIYHFLVALGVNTEKKVNYIKEKYRNFKFRW
jgi:uncharacterized membrane protein